MENNASSTTFVLVHGAWHDGTCWDRVVPLLEARGHVVHAPTLTGHGETADRLGPEVNLTTHADDVVGLILGKDLSRVVLVGHSYAGMVISAVANRIPERIARLVYVDAMVPEHGESAVDVMPAARQMIDAAARSATPWRIPPLPELPAPAGLFGVTDPQDVAWLRGILGDESVSCFVERVDQSNPALARVPRAHIRCVGFEMEGIERRPVPAVQPNGEAARVLELRSGHDCMVTVPAELTDLLVGLV